MIPLPFFNWIWELKQISTNRATKNIKPLLTDMSVIPGGVFWRGSNDGNRDEMPRHQISLPSYAIDKHPVTNEQFVRFLEVMGGEKDSNHQDIIRLKDSAESNAAEESSVLNQDTESIQSSA